MVTRINGFSGMDIDSLVKSMMTAKRASYDKITQNKQLVEWKRDSYREINSKLYDFRFNKLTDKYGKDSALNANKAIITGNKDALKADATADANGIDMKVQISKLATSATVQTTGTDKTYKGTSTLAEVDGVDLAGMSETARKDYLDKGFDLVINGVSFKDDNGKPLFNGLTSISSMISTINSNTKANVNASYDELTGQLIIRSKTSGPTGKVDIGGNTGTNSVINLFGGTPDKTVIETNGTGSGFLGSTKLSALTGATEPFSLKINNETFSFAGSATIDDVIAEVSSRAGANATASFDNATGKLVFTSKNGDAIKLGTDTGDNTLLNLFKGEKTFQSGENAKLNINGIDVEKDSNNFILNGITFNLLATTPPGETVNITTQRNPDNVLETIKGFIEDYNSLLSTLNTKTSEAKYRSFAPLTDEQKKEMKEADIKAWTEKSQSGLLKNDDILTSTVSQMRMIITANLSDLSAMGITTGKYYDEGKLILDESKLKSAISDNPQKILDLFQGSVSSPSTGIFDKLAEKVGNSINMISDRAGTDRFSGSITGAYKPESVMGRELKSYDSRMDTMLKNLTIAENRYYKQFTAMEQAMSKLNSQSSSLLSSLGLNS
ncbi:flagellar filament capping protein FliD [Paenibacillus sp. UASWS1643]|uniref:flagellar filament capping protein FliD n=1 Tax=Paenibacillus sp. UASWS1643 TaxID=2580422 RepID=UPI001238D7C9|nr:flagellar filament capping protein FliD [Paenibacillus sp. UASWS1643]KAA8756255.1 flagellar filament capping protein FliD [Paenibacillus sp. UASWS1643]